MVPPIECVHKSLFRKVLAPYCRWRDGVLQFDVSSNIEEETSFVESPSTVITSNYIVAVGGEMK